MIVYFSENHDYFAYSYQGIVYIKHTISNLIKYSADSYIRSCSPDKKTLLLSDSIIEFETGKTILKLDKLELAKQIKLGVDGKFFYTLENFPGYIFCNKVNNKSIQTYIREFYITSKNEVIVLHSKNIKIFNEDMDITFESNFINLNSNTAMLRTFTSKWFIYLNGSDIISNIPGNIEKENDKIGFYASNNCRVFKLSENKVQHIQFKEPRNAYSSKKNIYIDDNFNSFASNKDDLYATLLIPLVKADKSSPLHRLTLDSLSVIIKYI